MTKFRGLGRSFYVIVLALVLIGAFFIQPNVQAAVEEQSVTKLTTSFKANTATLDISATLKTGFFNDGVCDPQRRDCIVADANYGYEIDNASGNLVFRLDPFLYEPQGGPGTVNYSESLDVCSFSNGTYTLYFFGVSGAAGQTPERGSAEFIKSVGFTINHTNPSCLPTPEVGLVPIQKNYTYPAGFKVNLNDTYAVSNEGESGSNLDYTCFLTSFYEIVQDNVCNGSNLGADQSDIENFVVNASPAELKQLPSNTATVGQVKVVCAGPNCASLTQSQKEKTLNLVYSVSAPTCSLTASKTTINEGESVTLNWSSANTYETTPISSSNFGATTTSGTTTLSPTVTTTYSLTVNGITANSTASCSTTVNVTPTPVPHLSWVVGPGHFGNTSFISYRSTNFDTWQMRVTGGKPNNTVNLYLNGANLGSQGTTDSAGNLTFPAPAQTIVDGAEGPNYTYSVVVAGKTSDNTISANIKDFDVEAGPNVSIQKGSSGSLAVSVINKTPTAGPFDGDVEFTITNCPAGWTCAPVTTKTSANLAVSVPSGETAPTKTLTVRGTFDKNSSHPHWREDTVSVSITNVPVPDIVASCSALPNPVQTGSAVTFSASVSGGTGSYTYDWSALGGSVTSGTASSLTTTYSSIGTKNASVTVTSGGVQKVASCSVEVQSGPTPTVTSTITPTPVPTPLVSCTASPNSATIGQTVTFTALGSSGTTPYTYDWKGVVTGSGAIKTQTFSTTGPKTATVTLTDANNKTATASCSTQIDDLGVNLDGATDATNWTDTLTGPAPFNGIDLRADVSGSLIGTINYTFYCDSSDTSTSVISGHAAKFDSTNEDPKISPNVCDYAKAGVYHPKVIVERGSLAKQDRITVTVVEPATPLVSCTASPNSATIRQEVTFTALGSSGTTPYTYDWKGAVTGAGATKTQTFSTTGPKTATVTLTDANNKTATASCSTTITAPESLSVTLTANPNAGVNSISSVLTADVGGTAVGTINYSFWWNCNYTGTSVTEASNTNNCGDPNNSSNGQKFDGITTDPKSTSAHTYTPAGTYKALVIVERGSASPARATADIIVSEPGSPGVACTIFPSSAQTGGSVTLSATASGGSGSGYSYSWSIPGGNPASGSGSSLTTIYSSSGPKTATVTVRDSNNKTGSGSCNVTITDPETLSVDLQAARDSSNWQDALSGDAPLNDVDLRATVSSSTAGTINYTFYCNRVDFGTDVTLPASAKFDGTNNNPQSVTDVCDYTTAGTYTAKVIVERGSLAAEDRVTITVTTPPQAPNSPPNNPTNVTVTEPNYCTVGPSATVNWTYSDPEGDIQSAYQVQIDDQGSFNSPEFDSEEVPSTSNSTATGSGYLVFDVTYRARVKVWDSNGNESGWVTSNTWKTPKHDYPSVAFNWSPTTPFSGQSTAFTDQTICTQSTCNSWSWNFGDGSGATSQNPNHVYSTSGSYPVSLTVTDSTGFVCSTNQTISVQGPQPPDFKEVAP